MSSSAQKKPKKKSIVEHLAGLKKIKHIEIILAVAFVGILLVIYFSSDILGSFGGTAKSNKSDSTASTDDYTEYMESRLKNLLSSIKGAGSCDVMIHFESTPELVIAYIESESKSEGDNGSNSTSTSSPVILSQAGTQLPLIIKQLSPRVLGVVIVADGASDVKTKLDIINAVSVLLEISPDKVAVFERKQ